MCRKYLQNNFSKGINVFLQRKENVNVFKRAHAKKDLDKASTSRLHVFLSSLWNSVFNFYHPASFQYKLVIQAQQFLCKVESCVESK